MENSILITEAELSLSKIKDLLSGVIDFSLERQDVLHYSTQESFLSIIYSESGANEYEETELSEIKKKIKQPIFYVLDTNDFGLLKKFISNLSDNYNFLVDNDFGEIMDKRRFCKMQNFAEFFSPQMSDSPSIGNNKPE